MNKLNHSFHWLSSSPFPLYLFLLNFHYLIKDIHYPIEQCFHRDEFSNGKDISTHFFCIQEQNFFGMLNWKEEVSIEFEKWKIDPLMICWCFLLEPFSKTFILAWSNWLLMRWIWIDDINRWSSLEKVVMNQCNHSFFVVFKNTNLVCFIWMKRFSMNYLVLQKQWIDQLTNQHKT